MFKEEYYLNLQDTLDKFEKILIKDNYQKVKETKFIRQFEYISDDYSYKSIVTTEIKNGYLLKDVSQEWPFLILYQEETDLYNDEIYISDNYSPDQFFDDERKTDKEMEKEIEEIDKEAEKTIKEHLEKPEIYIRTGYKFQEKDSIGAKKIYPAIMEIDQFNDGGYQYLQPYKAYEIDTYLHSNVSVHELIRELNTADLIRLYKAFTDKEAYS
jgi:hypothetical protein